MLNAFDALKTYVTVRANDQRGVTTVEYAIMLFLVAIAVATAAPSISTAVQAVFTNAIAAMGQGA
jgi:Flp pilus assembly pilin Flp